MTIKRAESPATQCQHTLKDRQCPNEVATNSNYCLAHGGNKAEESLEKQKLRNYRLTKWNARIYRFSESSNIKSLRDEIGIVRMILEEQLETCQSQMDLILSSTRISLLVGQIEKLVSSCHKLETNLGEVLDKTALANFAGQVIRIIGEVVEDEAQLEAISIRITQLFIKEDDG